VTAKRASSSNRDPDPTAPEAEEARRDVAAQTGQDTDQTSADLDQTQADSDQSASDADQQTSFTDQALANRDQHASDRDQAVADWEHSESVGGRLADEAHEASREEREAASRERESTAALRARATAQRLETAARRDELAQVRDITAAARDRTAQARDNAVNARERAAETRERHAIETGNLDEAVETLRALRISGAAVRQRSVLERAAAAADRDAAAADRERAAADRQHAGLDELTGVFRRGTGELALTQEIARARRSGRPLVIAMFDINGLKVVNDHQGHAAGDSLLRDVAAAITSTLRAYDVAVRWGGDEFVCALSDVSAEVASDRVGEIQRSLEARRPGASISVGLAEPNDDETLESVVARADTALYRAKARRDA
jgi:diguanylate cyclase (GGDEF)-like protein